jgi:hypothetical protein
VVTFMFYPLYLWGKIIRCRLNRTINGKQSWSGSFADKGMLMQIIELQFRCHSGHGLAVSRHVNEVVCPGIKLMRSGMGVSLFESAF